MCLCLCPWNVTERYHHCMSANPRTTNTHTHTPTQWGSASCYEFHRAEVIGVCTLSSYITPSKRCTDGGEKVHCSLPLCQSFISEFTSFPITHSFLFFHFLPSCPFVFLSLRTPVILVFYLICTIYQQQHLKTSRVDKYSVVAHLNSVK